MRSARFLLAAAFIAQGPLVSAATRPDKPSLPVIRGATLTPTAFSDLPGWDADQHEHAFATFKLGCAAAPSLRAGLPPPPELGSICDAASVDNPDRAASKAFFERWFAPVRISPDQGNGFLTGYFEPEYAGSLQRNELFPTPLYGRPLDLVTLEQGSSLPGMPSLQSARRRSDGALEPYPTRREIEATDIAKNWPIIAWLRDPVDRFVMQVQGSARLRLPDGSVVRVAYAGRNGHPYTSLGRLLSQSENIPPSEMTMDRLVARLKGDPAWSRDFIWNNASFVFFRLAGELDPAQGPLGGAGVPLTAHRSIAADRTIWPYGLPMWLSGQVPTADRTRTQPLQRLTVIQDTGSAIVGPGRFDLFFGSGAEAGFIAGLTRHSIAATLLWPRRIGPDKAGSP